MRLQLGMKGYTNVLLFTKRGQGFSVIVDNCMWLQGKKIMGRVFAHVGQMIRSQEPERVRNQVASQVQQSR